MSAYKSPLKNVTLWFTGISGAGKTTIATGVVEKLESMGYRARNLDGDDFRDRLNKDLGFSVRDRQENIRRVSEVATIVAELGVITVVSLISPLRDARSQARKIHDKRDIIFLECYIDTPLEECERRDVKGLYKKCRNGELKNFTGIDSPYEVPENPELVIRTLDLKVEECINKIISLLEKRECIESSTWPKLMKLNEQASASKDNHKSENGFNHQNGFHKNGHVKECELIEENLIQNSILRSSHDHETSTKRDCLQKMFESIDQPMKPCIKELFVSEVEKKNLISRLGSIPRLDITKIDLQWIQVLSEGWATPLEGFMREKEYMECVFTGSLEGGKINQTIPIVLAVEDEDKIGLEKAREIGLWYEGECYAVLKDPEFYRHRKEERCARTFCTTHSGHPMIEMIYKSGDYLVGGRLRVLDRIKWNDGLDEYRLTPIELQKRFEAIQADAVYAFQTRNPIHNGHALLMQETRKRLLEKGYKKPTLLLHPLGGWTKGDDVPLKVRIEQHKAVLSEGILDAENTVLAIFPSPMNYAGPIEVQWHCKARLVTGANFYIVGRDPAGIPHPDGSGDLYQPEYGSEVLKKARGLDRLEVIPFRPAAYNKKKGFMDFYDPSREEEYEFISGTKMRTLARSGEKPPKGFMSDKGWEVLANFYRRELAGKNRDDSSSRP